MAIEFSPTWGVMVCTEPGTSLISLQLMPASSSNPAARIPTHITGICAVSRSGCFSCSRAWEVTCSLRDPHMPWSDPNMTAPGVFLVDRRVYSRVSGSWRSTIPRAMSRVWAYATRDWDAASYWRILTAASDFMVRTTECRSPVLSILRLSCSRVCISAFFFEGFYGILCGFNKGVNGFFINFFPGGDFFHHPLVVGVGSLSYVLLGIRNISQFNIIQYPVGQGNQYGNLVR